MSHRLNNAIVNLLLAASVGLVVAPVGRAEATLVKADTSLVKADTSLGKADPSLGKADPSLGKADPSLGKADPSLAAIDASLAKTDVPLTGTVSKLEINGGMGQQANELTDAAWENSETAKDIDALIKKYSSVGHKSVVFAKEWANTMIPYRGFGPSKEGAAILLEKVKKIKTLAGAEYLKQRLTDELHTKVVTSLLQMSEGLDQSDTLHGKQLIAEAYNRMRGLVGDDKAGEAVKLMINWSKGLSVPQSAFQKKTWDVATLQQNVRSATGLSVTADPVFGLVVKKVKKYNRGKVMSAVGQLVEAGAGSGVLFAPGMLIPVAIQAADGLFVAGTGGCESTKMVNELYYAKRMESRWKRLNEESQLALTSYEMALDHHSPALLACSESVMQDLVGTDKAKELLGQTVLPENPLAATYDQKAEKARAAYEEAVNVKMHAKFKEDKDLKTDPELKAAAGGKTDEDKTSAVKTADARTADAKTADTKTPEAKTADDSSNSAESDADKTADKSKRHKHKESKTKEAKKNTHEKIGRVNEDAPLFAERDTVWMR